jgi:hypothetical protein
VKLVSFVRPNAVEACVGLLSADGARVADLTAIGLEDIYAALPRFSQLGRLATHLIQAPGAVAYPVGNVRLLAPVPYARFVREGRLVASANGGEPNGTPHGELPQFGVAHAVEREELVFADPAEIGGPGAHITCGPDEILGFGVVGVLRMGGRDINEREAAGHIGGLTLFAEWHDPLTGAHRPDAIVMGPSLTPPELFAEADDVVLIPPDGGVRHAGTAGALTALARLIALASTRYTLRAGDLFVFDAGAAEVELAPGTHAELVVESPWAGSLAHTAHRSG